MQESSLHSVSWYVELQWQAGRRSSAVELVLMHGASVGFAQDP
jgi:hypothetical protein